MSKEDIEFTEEDTRETKKKNIIVLMIISRVLKKL